MTYVIYRVSRPEIEKISEELCNQFTPKEFQAIYEHEMETPYSFITTDVRRPLNERIYSRFNYPITLQDIRGANDVPLKPNEIKNVLEHQNGESSSETEEDQ